MSRISALAVSPFRLFGKLESGTEDGFVEFCKLCDLGVRLFEFFFEPGRPFEFLDRVFFCCEALSARRAFTASGFVMFSIIYLDYISSASALAFHDLK